jgi:serine/threonine-protein kinase
MVDLLVRLKAALGARYAIEGELGAGGAATVYLAEDRKHHRKVAVKVFRQELGSSLGPERFLREIAIAAQLQHPHILPVHDSGQADGLLFYVMPFVEGPSLRQRLLREGELSIPEAVRILRDVADALAYAHRHGVVHRDIKPENVMLSDRHAMVTDFGVAKALTEAAEVKGETTRGVALGTPTYMAPEQGAADPHMDHRADLYAFGVVAYEVLTGRTPFLAAGPQAMLAAHLTGDVEPVGQLRGSIPPVLARLVMKCLEKKPADRYQTADELVEELESLATPSGGTLPLTGRTIGRWGEPRSRLAVGFLGIVVIGGVLWALSGPVRGPVDVAVEMVADTASVAVLECRPEAGYQVDPFLTQGLTQQIIARLVQTPDLVVINTSSVLPLSGSGLSTRQVADTLDVRYVFQCSVTQSGGAVRVFGQLLEARTQAVRWAQPFQSDGDLQGELGDRIALEVSRALTGSGRALPTQGLASRSAQPGATRALLEGNYQLHRRNPTALRAAVDAYSRAIEIDQSFAPAYAALASAFGLSLPYMADLGRSPYGAFGMGLALATRAVQLDSTLAVGYAIRGYIMTKAYGPSEQIAADFARAMRHGPNSADTRGWYAHYLHREGEHGSGLAQAERAITLDPIAPGRRVGLALDAIAAGEYTRAVTEADHALVLEPGLGSALRIRAVAALLSGDAGACVRSGASRGTIAPCAHSVGAVEEARSIADSLEAAYGDGPEGPDSVLPRALIARDLACYHGWVGNAQEAMRWILQAFALSPTGVDFRLLHSHMFEPIRTSPEFEAVVKRIEADVWSRTEEERRRSLTELGSPFR